MRQTLMIGYAGVLAAVAGFVNSVALLVLAFPVGNLTGSTTKLGMDAADPLLFESCVLAGILFGFLAGAAIAGAALAATRTHTGWRHAAILLGEALLLIAAIGIEHPVAKAGIAATACGLQNGVTSNFREMAIRTTHITGTITDLGLIIGRSRHHGIDGWKVGVLTVSVALFIVGVVAGAVAGQWLGDFALVVPAGVCVAVAVASVLYDRRRAVGPPPASAPEPSYAHTR